MNHATLLACALALGGVTSAQAQNDADLRNDIATPGDTTTHGMGYNNQRCSPLKKINKSNVSKMVPVWNYSLNNLHGQESQPLIFDRVMFVTTHTATIAINPLTGRQVCKQDLEFASDVFKMACCGLLNRGLAIYNSKVYRATLDAHLIAYDAKPGKQLWKSNAADYQDGHAMTSAPLIANGVLMTGIAGGEYGTRGFIDGWNPDTDAKMWRFYTTAASTDKGADTWPGDTAMKGGAPTWLTGIYDADLDLVYWGFGNGGPWNAEVRKGDNLHINSVLAIKPKTGELQWHCQFSPDAVVGTMEGTVLNLYRSGLLRPHIVSVSRGKEVLDMLESGNLDATLVPIDRFDAWRAKNPNHQLRRESYVHPLCINIGFVARFDTPEVLAVTDKVINAARASGELQHWTLDAGGRCHLDRTQHASCG